MIKKTTHLAILAAVALSCSVASAQNFTFINPLTDLGIATGGSGPFSNTFDISNELGLGQGSVLLNVSNGFTNAGSPSSSFTVSDDEETTFTLLGTTDVLAQVSHGSFLGSPGFQTGSQSRDGVRGIQSFNLVSNLDGDYQFGSTPNGDAIPGGGNFFVDYIGPDTGNLEQNSSSFLFESVAPVTSFTVFSNNTNQLNNNFSVGFAQVPEPSSGILFVFATGLIALRRNRRS